MIISTWNCRGASAKSFPNLLRDIVSKYGIQVMALLETRISGDKADRVVKKLGFNNWLRVEATGFAGEIWLLWNEDDIRVDYILSDIQILHCKLFDKDKEEGAFVTFVYGEPNPQLRVAL